MDMALAIVDYLEIKGDIIFADFLFSIEKSLIPRPDPKSTIKESDLKERYISFLKTQNFSKILSQIKADSTITLDRIHLTFEEFFVKLLNELDIKRDGAQRKLEDDQRSLIYNRSDKKQLAEMKISKWTDINYNEISKLEGLLTDERVKTTYLQAKDNFKRNYERTLMQIDRTIRSSATKFAKSFIDYIQKDRKSYLPPAPKAPAPRTGGFS